MRISVLGFGFNRTFMELKYNIPEWVELQKQRFNRTFMELKSRNGITVERNTVGLIVPLWN